MRSASSFPAFPPTRLYKSAVGATGYAPPRRPADAGGADAHRRLPNAAGRTRGVCRVGVRGVRWGPGRLAGRGRDDGDR